jgi:hypothetical protein
MTPNCTLKKLSNNSKFFMQQKTTPTIIELKSNNISNDTDTYLRALLNHADCGHRPTKCIMCNGSDELFIKNNVQRMDKGNFNWHFNLLFSSDGQSLDRELLSKAYEQYKVKTTLLRQHSEIKNSATPVSIIIGKQVCPHE